MDYVGNAETTPPPEMKYIFAIYLGLMLAALLIGATGYYHARIVFGVLLLVGAAFLALAAAGQAEQRKKKEEEHEQAQAARLQEIRQWLDAQQARFGPLLDTPAEQGPAPGNETGNTPEVDLRVLPGQWSAGRKVPAEKPNGQGWQL